MFSVRQCEKSALVQVGVEVLHPHRVHVSVKDDPLTLLKLTTHVVYDPGINGNTQ